jgi:type IV secretion system protein VirD4
VEITAGESMNAQKLAINILGFLIAFAVLSVAGLYAGAFLFAQSQKIPFDKITMFTLFDYYYVYGHIKKTRQIIALCSLIAASVPLGTLGLFIWGWIESKKRPLHGNARFANRAELTESGLLPANKKEKEETPPSLLIGKVGNEFLKLTGSKFCYLAAPTRSGKGVGIVVPNLLWYTDSVVVFDPKLENWNLTAGYRANVLKQEVFLFSPDHPEMMTHRWNPLSYIRRDVLHRVADIQNIGSMLYPSQSVDGNTAFFNESAQTLFLGLVLYLLDTPKQECSLNSLVKLTAPDTGVGLDLWIKSTISQRDIGDSPLSPDCKKALLSFASNSDNTRAGILASCIAPLNIFRDPITAAATNEDDFDLREVRKKRMTIYIGIQPRNLEKYSRLVNLFFSQLINENTHELPEQNPALKYECLLLIDEFASLERIGIIEKSIAYIAGYKLRLLLIFQNQSQCVRHYTQEGARTLFSNIACQIIFAPKEEADAKQYSEMLGYTTVKSVSNSRQLTGKSNRSESQSDQRRALLLPQEIKEIGQEKSIIVLENTKPIMAEKIRWYSDPAFEGKGNLAVPYVPQLKKDKLEEWVRGGRAMTLEEVNNNPVSSIENVKQILNNIEKMGLDELDLALLVANA